MRPLALLDHFHRARRAAAVERAHLLEPVLARPSDDSAATRTPSARPGSRSAGSRESRPAPAPRRTSGWRICSAPTQMPIIMHDREGVDVEVGDDDQVALLAAAHVSRYMNQLRSARRSRRCCRASASRPSACRSCRRCTAGRRDRLRIDLPSAEHRRRSSRAENSASDSRAVDARRGSGRLARVFGERRDDDALDRGLIARTASTSGASASSVIEHRGCRNRSRRSAPRAPCSSG